MKIRFKKSLFFVATILFLTSGTGKTNEIRIKFIGNCGLYLTDGKMNIYIDFPYKSGAFKYMKFEKAELDSIKENSIFIFTHKHPDHYSGKNMRRTLRNKQGKKYGKWNLKQLEKLSNDTGDFSIQAIETKHKFSLKHYSYLITWHGRRLYFSGDTETSDTVLTFKNLDWAFVPYWIMIDINKKNVQIDSEMIGVYHFYPNMKITYNSPEKIKTLMNQGEIITLPY
jgi:L-ascorbate metabolism protein UlaG (beta-lactamase superfamily)